ncbi:MAG: uroporphyrinogen-III C-methyltransferase [Meiothermus sp.]|uniref:uroporphyrinogen-III C-methyltransferase n=1 Tax=Meiothermus sp. TaxID=1955249 RepID=UPI0025D7EBD6|nr:uroporphyrinogen-III C-methyltransferase [Meiothermus sp.]MCS7193840.1 uroporphyrinogen-III C-methyltransferase [Meiothermus sp.]MDW8090300.1 uroporphyrinogen-III C-methyltransferase [Meiothermus sp.]
MRGKVYLVGAGPGDPELLTLRAYRVLQEAQVVLYDRLVSPDVLELVNPKAHRIYVGKTRGTQTQAQEKILSLLLAYARSNRQVVRLKGGDPMVYGRGAEEWAFLAQHQIEVEVVPGVSSALAAPALAGIPLTLRGVAHSFAVVSGQIAGGLYPSLERVAQAETLVILMGVERRVELAHALIRLGRKPEEPVAFVERSTTPHERIIVSTLAEVAAGGAAVEAPAVWVLGEVVAHRLPTGAKGHRAIQTLAF